MYSIRSPLLAKPCIVRASAPKRGALVIRAAGITSNDFKTGMSIEIDNQPWRVLEFLHVKPGKGAAFVRTKLKSYTTGNVNEKTFRAGEPVDLAQVEKRDMQFTYLEGEDCVFMDMESFEETKVKKDDAWARFMKEGQIVSVMQWNGNTIGVDMPLSVELKVTAAEPGLKGNTAGGNPTKTCTLETGANIQVPLFVNEGDVLKINTETGEYLGRINS